MKKFKYYQYVLIEWHNSQHEIIKFVSNKKITINKVLSKINDFDSEEDTITFVDKPKTVIL